MDIIRNCFEQIFAEMLMHISFVSDLSTCVDAISYSDRDCTVCEICDFLHAKEHKHALQENIFTSAVQSLPIQGRHFSRTAPVEGAYNVT